MIGSMTCPQCDGVGQDEESTEHCKHCHGWGVLHMVEAPCPTCTGKKLPGHLRCNHCYGSGRLVRVAPIAGAVKGDKDNTISVLIADAVPMTSMREALTLLRVGYEGAEPEFGKELGRLAALLDLSSQYDGHPIASWLKEDVLIFEPSGIWVQRGDQACRIYEYETR